MENEIQELVTKQEEVRDKEPSSRGRFLRYLILWAAVFVLVFGAYRIGVSAGKDSAWGGEAPAFPLDETAVINTGDEKQTLDFSLFWRTWNVLEEKFVDTEALDARELMYGAIDGMLHASGDPYTAFFDPEENESFDESISGEFEGIGAELEMRDELITVVAPLTGTPADRAGIRAGDIILEVDGEDVTDVSLIEGVSRMRGPKGTEVTLTVFREETREQREITIVRDTIQVKSVEFEMRGGTALVSIRQFGEKTLGEFRTAISRALSSGAEGMVIDLRNNPGGYLKTAIDMGGMLLPDGSVVLIEEDSAGNRQEERSAATAVTDELLELPLAVIINRGSASASEILAGALSHHRNNVTIVGETSFGKGSVQELVPLPQKTAAKITVARWLTPDGTQIDGNGITPDVEVERTDEDYEADRDPQLEKALEVVE